MSHSLLDMVQSTVYALSIEDPEASQREAAEVLEWLQRVVTGGDQFRTLFPRMRAASVSLQNPSVGRSTIVEVDFRLVGPLEELQRFILALHAPIPVDPNTDEYNAPGLSPHTRHYPGSDRADNRGLYLPSADPPKGKADALSRRIKKSALQKQLRVDPKEIVPGEEPEIEVDDLPY